MSASDALALSARNGQTHAVRNPRWMVLLLLFCTSTSTAILSFFSQLFVRWCTLNFSSIQATFDLPNAIAACIAGHVLLVSFGWWLSFKDSHLQGSGIPEIRCLMQGARLHDYLGWRVLLKKVIAHACVLGSQLPLGKEGPYVHFALCIEQWLRTHVRCFSSASFDGTLGRRVLLTSASAGVCACFAAPIGGMLFALECCGSLFVVYDIILCFFSGFSAALVCRFLNALLFNFAGINILSFPQGIQVTTESVEKMTFVVLSALVGLLMGAVGRLFLRLQRWISQFPFVKRGHGLPFVITVTLLNTLCLFACPLLRCTNPQLLRTLLDPRPGVVFPEDPSTWSFQVWRLERELPEVARLLLSCVIEAVLVVSALIMPVPTGCIAPLYRVGSMMGRVIGILAAKLDILPGHEGALAAVGACALPSAVCQAFSMAVVVFENIEDGPALLLALMSASLTANLVSRSFGPSIFDAALFRRRLSGVSAQVSSWAAWESVQQHMRPPALIAVPDAKQPPCPTQLEAASALKYGCLVDGTTGLFRACVRLDEARAHASAGNFDSCPLIHLPVVPPWLSLEEAVMMMIVGEVDAACVGIGGELHGMILLEDVRDQEALRHCNAGSDAQQPALEMRQSIRLPTRVMCLNTPIRA